ncbi:MAG: SapC family protein [Gammaproteobacteria bacterium]|nr:SapC family protein [Gammaproteobacteria bacterium]
MPDREALDDRSRIVPFDSQIHAGLGIDPQQLKHFSARHNAITINLVEFFYASQHFPIVFVKTDNDMMQTSAITGLQKNENLFVGEQGHWQQHVYVPAYIRRFPFYTADANDKTKPDKKIIMVDEAGLVECDDPFFDKSGHATEKWSQVESFIADYISAEKMTVRFATKLDRLGLMEPFDAQINPQQKNSLRVSGMHRVDENRLNNLPAKVIKDLMQEGEMSRIYAHLISLENFAKLLDLSVIQQQADATRHQAN